MEQDHDHESRRYFALGVSAAKDGVYHAIAGVPAGVVPNSFCRVVEDVFLNNPDYCVVSHADGAGTKSILAYLHYAIHRDPAVFKGIAQDAIVMNLDDLLCVGVTQGFAVSSIINRNAKRIDDLVVKAIVDGSQEFIQRMNDLSISMVHCGGETADVGDIVKSIVVDSVITARMPKDRLIANQVEPDDAIVSLASGGNPCSYEDKWNSGIGSNGLTAARHELLSASVSRRFPEAFDDAIPESVRYRGPFELGQQLPGTSVSVLDALLSPTRTFAPVIAIVLDNFFPSISGLVHCTGGGQLKCLRFGDGISFVKDLGADIPPVFRAIKDASGMSWGEMAKIFNLGYRMEIYCRPQVARDIVAVANSFGIEARIVGHTARISAGANILSLTVEGEKWEYQRMR